MNIQNQAPYYDDYDQSKNYVQILARPGYAEQAREFTQAQTIMRDLIERVGNGIFSNGGIVSGCSCLIDTDKKHVTIQSGRIFLGGLVRIINEPVILEIDGVGVETISAKIKSKIITSVQDNTLRDPAQAYENYGQEGANRLQEVVEFEVNSTDENSAIIYTLVDGEVLKEITDSDYYSQIIDTLARRTFDENGNYKVEGLNIRAKSSQDQEGKVGVSVTSGKAYVNGYEVEKRTASSIYLDQATEVRSVLHEPKIYSATDQKYYLSNYPLSKINEIMIEVQVTAEAHQRLTGGLGGAEPLNHSPVVSVSDVFAGDTHYVKNRDYRLINDQIDWSLNSSTSIEPALGNTYYVTYTYNKAAEEGVDFDVLSDENGYYVQFREGVNIVENSSTEISYEYYLSRRDLILLDSNGELSFIKGKSERETNLMTPYNMDKSKIELGYVDITANSSNVTIVNYKTERMTQAQIYNLSRRIDDLEYNQALEDLDDEAVEGEAATSLKGVYTDGFIGISKCDLNYYVDEDDKFDCCIDVDMGEMTLPVSTEASSIKIRESSSLYSNIGRVISAPFEHELALQQPLATGKMLVNPYASYNPLAKVILNPEIDNWVDTDKMDIYDTINNQNYTTSRNTVSSYAVFNTHRWHSLQRSSTTTSTRYTGTTTSVAVSTVVQESIIEYMRVKTIQISGSSFESGEDNIVCYFNEQKVMMTPTGSSEAGTEAGSIRCDENGSFTAEITIPANTPCGSVSVQLKGDISSGKAIYTANGTLRTTITTTTTTNTDNYNVLITTHNVYESDPLAQTFLFNGNNPVVITKIGLYFYAKDSKRPCVVQVRNVVNGYPGETVYAEVLVPSSQVKTSSDASEVTEVVLNQPVYCNPGTFYCFVVLSDSNAYGLFYGQLAKTTIDTGMIVTTNPYATGVMFSSSNSSTWTAHQDSDLKFDLYKANYTGNGEIIFDDVTVNQINSLVLAAEYVDYKNAGVDWFYRASANNNDINTATWLPLDTYTQRELNEVSKIIQLKAILNVNYQTSPFLADDCINLIGFIDSTKGIYVSRSIGLSDPYTKLKIQYQLCSPAGTSCRVYYKDDELSDWIEVVQGDNVTLNTIQIDEEFNEYEWELSKIAHDSSKFYKIKIVISTNNVFNRPRVRKLRSILKY